MDLCSFPVDLDETKGFTADQYFILKNARENFIKSFKRNTQRNQNTPRRNSRV